jgi:AmiR/NasT family two-component response regulator
MPTYLIAQASGMVSVQAQCTPDEALVLLDERAADTRQTLKEVALAVVEQKTRFD